MTTPQTPEQLRDRFRDPRLHFNRDKGNLVTFHAKTALGELKLFLHGAHVSHWQPAGQKPVLWMSEHSQYAADQPIRGGVPICFPWFGANIDNPALPAHGPARRREWELVHAGIAVEDIIEAELALTIEPFRLHYFVRAGHELQMRMRIQNTDDRPQKYELALHTYLAVGDVRQVMITGLSGRKYIDKVRDGEIGVQPRGPIDISSETDRVYIDSIQSVVVHDPLLKRRLIIDKDGSRSTVVWNPGIDKSRTMPDFGDDEWPGMLCVETANVGPNRVEIAGGDTLGTEALIRVETDE